MSEAAKAFAEKTGARLTLPTVPLHRRENTRDYFTRNSVLSAKDFYVQEDGNQAQAEQPEDEQ